MAEKRLNVCMCPAVHVTLIDISLWEVGLSDCRSCNTDLEESS